MAAHVRPPMGQGSTGYYNDEDYADAYPASTDERASTRLDSPDFQLPAAHEDVTTDSAPELQHDSPLGQNDLGGYEAQNSPFPAATNLVGMDSPELQSAFDRLQTQGQGPLPRPGYEDTYLKTQAQERKNLLGYLHSQGVQVEPTPEGEHRVVTHEDGQPAFRPQTSPAFQGENGRWYKSHRDERGTVSQVDLLGTKQYHTDSKTGDRFIFDETGAPVIIGQDEGVTQRRKIIAARQNLADENTADHLTIAQVAASIQVPKALVHQLRSSSVVGEDGLGEVVSTLETKVRNLSAGVKPDDKTSLPALELADAQGKLDQFHREHPEYQTAQDAIEAGKGIIQSKQTLIRNRQAARLLLGTHDNGPQIASMLPREQLRSITGDDASTGDVEALAGANAVQDDSSHVQALAKTLLSLRDSGVKSVGGRPIDEAITGLASMKPQAAVKAPEKVQPSKHGFWGNFVGSMVSHTAESLDAMGEGASRLFGATDAAERDAQDRRNLAELESGNISDSNPYKGGTLNKLIDPARQRDFSTGVARVLPDIAGIAAAPEFALPAIVARGVAEGASEAGDKGENRGIGALKGGAKAGATLAAFGAAGKLAKGLIPSITEPAQRFFATAGISTAVNALADATITRLFGGSAIPQTPDEWAERGLFALFFGAHSGLHEAKLPSQIRDAQSQISTLPEKIQSAQAQLATLDAARPLVEEQAKQDDSLQTTLSQMEQTRVAAEKFLKAQNPKLVAKLNENAQKAVDSTKEEPPDTGAGGTSVPTKPTPPPAPTVTAADIRDRLAQKADLMGKISEARDAGQHEQVAVLKDQASQIDSELQAANRSAIQQIDPAVREDLAKRVDPSLNRQGLEQASVNGSSFHLASVGEKARDLYIPAEKEPLIAAGVKQAGPHEALAQYLVDQHVGQLVAKDLLSVAKGGTLDLAKATRLEELGLLYHQNDPENPGKTVMVVTDDALPMFPKGVREQLAKNPSALKVAQTPGNPQDVGTTHYEAGQKILAEAVQAQPEPVQPTVGAKMDLAELSEPERRNLDAVLKGFGREALLFKALGVMRPEFVHLGDSSGIMVQGDRLLLDGHALKRQFDAVSQHGAKATRWVKDVLREELIHVAQFKAVEETGQTPEEYYGHVFQGLPEDLLKAAGKGYEGFSDLAEWQQAAEAVRMVIQGRWKGTITERVFKAIEDVVNYLKGLKVEDSPLLAEAVERTEAVLEDARKSVEASSRKVELERKAEEGRRKKEAQSQAIPESASVQPEENAPANQVSARGEPEPETGGRLAPAGQDSGGADVNATEPKGQPAPITQGPRRSFRANLPPAPGGHDFLDDYIEAGRITSPSFLKSQGKELGGEYDGARQLPGGSWWSYIFATGKDKGNRPDDIAQALYDAGKLNDSTPDALWEKIRETIQTRKSAARSKRSNEASGKSQLAKAERFQRDAVDPRQKGPAVQVNELNVGDKVMVGKEELTVSKVNPDTDEVTLEDGKKYGVQKVEANSVIYGEVEKNLEEGAADQFPGSEPGAASAQAETIPGTKSVATRITSAEERFIEFARETGELTRQQAIRALDSYHKNKAIKIDPVGGQFTFTHGGFAERDVLRRAAGIEEEAPTAQAAPSTPETAPVSAPNIPTLRPNEKGTSDLFQGSDAPFNLAGEAGIDWEKRQAEKAKAEQDAAEAKAKQDREQQDLFATKAEAQPEVKPAGIQDFGEKIGGARKDTSTSTGRTGRAKTEDERPAWARRYNISEIIASHKEGDIGRWSISDSKNTDWKGDPRQIGETFATKAEAEAAIPLVAVARNHRVTMTKEPGSPAADKDGYIYEIMRDVSDRKRVKVVQQDFSTREEAMRYMAEHAKEILEAKTVFREELFATPEKPVRTGVARREGPATPEMFKEAFGFRGVEFGNWMRQDGDGKERKEVLNHAYDGLHDLAEVLGVPAKALSLNGELGLAFGARGQGAQGAKAHYERNYAVINLTKMSGAGSLAHEWLHALDHYLGRLDGKAASEMVKNEAGHLIFPDSTRGDLASHGFSFKSKAREELRKAFDNVISTIFKKGVQYVEDTEKAQKFVKATRDSLGEALDSLRKELTAQKDPTYWKRNNKPATPEQLAEFDKLAEQLKDGNGLDTKWRTTADPGTPAKSRGGMAGRTTNDTLEALSAIYKAVRGRSGFSKEGGGAIDDLRGYMVRYAQRIQMLKDADSSTEKTKTVPTDFAMNAKRIDQGSATDYWTTPHEMLARAFSSYVEDAIAKGGGKSDFLAYGSDNRLPEYRMFNLRPFPEGAERVAINKTFDDLFQTLKSKETEKGTALFASKARDPIPEAYSALAQRTGFPAVSIGHLAEESGLPLHKIKGEALKAWKEGRAVLSLGDWSLSDEATQKGAIVVNGDKYLQIRFLPEGNGLAGSKAPGSNDRMPHDDAAAHYSADASKSSSQDASDVYVSMRPAGQNTTGKTVYRGRASIEKPEKWTQRYSHVEDPKAFVEHYNRRMDIPVGPLSREQYEEEVKKWGLTPSSDARIVEMKDVMEHGDFGMDHYLTDPELRQRGIELQLAQQRFAAIKPAREGIETLPPELINILMGRGLTYQQIDKMARENDLPKLDLNDKPENPDSRAPDGGALSASKAGSDDFGFGFRDHPDKIKRDAYKEGRADQKEVQKEKVSAAREAGAENVKEAKGEVRERMLDRIVGLKAKIADSVSKFEAYRETLKQAERAGKAGRKAGEQETKATLNQADRWLEADMRQVRSMLIESAKALLPTERQGRFLEAITKTLQRPSLFHGDTANMYGRAHELVRRMEEYAHEVHRHNLIDEIREGLSKALKSPSVDVNYKTKLEAIQNRYSFVKLSAAKRAELQSRRDYVRQQELKGNPANIPAAELAELKRLTMPHIDELPTDAMEALKDRIGLLDAQGRLTVKLRAQAFTREREAREEALKSAVTTPYEKSGLIADLPPGKPGPKTELTAMQRFQNKFTRAWDQVKVTADRALMPIDAAFDMLGESKGSYSGWLFRHLRGPIDLAYNESLSNMREVNARLDSIIEKHKLNKGNARRIGTYAIAQQEGGRERLIAQGIPEERIKQIEDSMTAPEMAAFREMRKTMDATYPKLRATMRDLYNQDVPAVDQYFPMIRDWQEYQKTAELPPAKDPSTGEPVGMDELATWKLIQEDIGPKNKTSVEKGFTIERLKGAQTAVKIDAFDVYRRHMQDVFHLLNTQRHLKMAGEIMRSPLAQEKFGRAGRQVVMDWLDTIARNGGVGANQRIQLLDQLRRMSSIGMIGFRLSSTFKHASNAALAIPHVGPTWYLKGLATALSKESQAFLRTNFAETFAREGGEQAIEEVSKTSKIARAGFWGIRQIDRLDAQAAALGYYMKALAAKGVDPEKFASLPIDREAQQDALVRMRRIVASPHPKDSPQVLSRGLGLGGNVSVARTVLQFGNIFLDRWSNIRHDLINGVRHGEHSQAAVVAVGILAAIAAESGIVMGTRNLANAVTGHRDKEEKGLGDELGHEALRQVPYVSQLLQAILYKRSGIAAIDAPVQALSEIGNTAKAKTGASQAKHLVNAAGGAAAVFGVPGAGQATDLARKVMGTNDESEVQKILREKGIAKPESHAKDRKAITEALRDKKISPTEALQQARGLGSTPQQAKGLVKRAAKDPSEAEFERLPLKTAIEVFRAADPEQKKKWFAALQRKHAANRAVALN